MARKPSYSLATAMEIRLNRESGVALKDAAALAGVSVATACRALAALRKKLGPEKFKGPFADAAGHRARAHLYSDSANSQNLTSNTDG